MQLDTQHWHVAVTYPGHRDGNEDQPFEDVDRALDYANETWDTFREDGHQVTKVDRPGDDRTGVIERYRAADGKGGTVAVVEVRPPRAVAESPPSWVAVSWPIWVEVNSATSAEVSPFIWVTVMPTAARIWNQSVWVDPGAGPAPW